MTIHRLALVASLGLTTGLVLVAPSSEAASPAVTVFTDPAGDAGSVLANRPVPGSDALGADLVRGSVRRRGDALEFTAEFATMPPQGFLPEGGRLLWHLRVGSSYSRFSVKSVDIGKPDVAAGSGTERVGHTWLAGQFRLETCLTQAYGPAVQLFNCKTAAELHGTVSPTARTATWQLPLRLVRAVPGTRITTGVGGASDSGCPVCTVEHAAERSHTPTGELDAVSGPFQDYVIPR